MTLFLIWLTLIVCRYISHKEVNTDYHSSNVIEYSIMLQKRLIYTAVTRAYKSLILLVKKEAFFKGIVVRKWLEKTTLKQRLIAEVDFYEQR